MYLLTTGLIIFLGVHSVSVAALDWRNAMAEKLGEQRWKGLYSVAAFVGLALIIYGYGLARQQPVVVYTTPVFFRHVSMLLMLPVFPLLLATYLPGAIKTKIKNPMLAAVKLWALSHLLVNGMLADILLFGGFLAWAVVDTISINRRPPKAIPTLPATPLNDIAAVVGGLLLYLVFVFFLHQWLIGVRLF